MEQNSPDLLEEYQEQVYLDPVPAGTRFLNYLIDRITFTALALGAGALYGIVLASRGDSFDDTETGGEILFFYFIGFLLVLGYYTLSEGSSKGRTLGKLVTGTIVVKDDGSPITYKDAFLRTLCRFIPFNAFSAFNGRPWHDSITRTMVIKKPG